MKTLVAALGAIAALSTAAVPVVASAQGYYTDRYGHRVYRGHGYGYRHGYYNCRRAQRSSANKGTLAGALVGGASGALIGGDALGALVGAGVGAVGGHEIAKSRVRC